LVAHPIRKRARIGPRTLGGQKNACQVKKLLRCKRLHAVTSHTVRSESCLHGRHRCVLSAQKRLFASAFLLSKLDEFASDVMLLAKLSAF
jgi:hypothetical protein